MADASTHPSRAKRPFSRFSSPTTRRRTPSRLVQDALRVDGSLPTTVAGVEAGIVTVFLGIRGVVLLQLAVALPTSVAHAREPVLSVALATLAYGWSAYLAWYLLRRGSLRTRLVSVDVAVACTLLAMQSVTVANGANFLTWDGWGFGVTLNTAALAALGLRTRVRTVMAVALLTAAYLTPLLMVPFTAGQRVSGLTNAVAYSAFAFAARVAAGYLRRLGSASDASKAEAARLAREAQIDRTRDLLHDQSSVLAMLSNIGEDPALDKTLRKAATRQAAKVQFFMAGQDRFAGRATTLADAVLSAAEEFPDLPLTCSVDLARDIRLAPEELAAVSAAVGTLLDNVRRHSQARTCVLHADSPSSSSWEVVVSDDGVGFRPERIAPGYGLSRLVARAMQSIGATAQVTSQPGEGTVVTITGRR